jgi:hypothetical protein
LAVNVGSAPDDPEVVGEGHQPQHLPRAKPPRALLSRRRPDVLPMASRTRDSPSPVGRRFPPEKPGSNNSKGRFGPPRRKGPSPSLERRAGAVFPDVLRGSCPCRCCGATRRSTHAVLCDARGASRQRRPRRHVRSRWLPNGPR